VKKEVTIPKNPPTIEIANESVCTRLSNAYVVSSKEKTIIAKGSYGPNCPAVSIRNCKSMKVCLTGLKNSVTQES
jgi:hypothetical protein